MVLNETATLNFRLVESALDFNLLVLSADAKAEEQSQTIAVDDFLDAQKLKLLNEVDIALPSAKYGEKAITETGLFLRTRILKVHCDAPAFEPSRQEFSTDIDALTKGALTFTLMPKQPGEQIISFSLLSPDNIAKGFITVRCTVLKHHRKLTTFAAKVLAAITVCLGLLSTAFTIVEKLLKLVK